VDEARERGDRLKDYLKRRHCHDEILVHCPLSLDRDGYYEVVFESVKGLGSRLAQMAGVDLDGNAAVDKTLAGASPIIRLNNFVTKTDKSEQTGIAALAHGVLSAFRNPAAHETKINWSISEEDALDVLATVSLIHRRLDHATVVGR
jgi:uncharacterized protein (TIGR02391 family)